MQCLSQAIQLFSGSREWLRIVREIAAKRRSRSSGEREVRDAATLLRKRIGVIRDERDNNFVRLTPPHLRGNE